MAELDVVLMSGRGHDQAAPQTSSPSPNLIELLPEHAAELELTFRSDRDGPPLRAGERHTHSRYGVETWILAGNA